MLEVKRKILAKGSRCSVQRKDAKVRKRLPVISVNGTGTEDFVIGSARRYGSLAGSVQGRLPRIVLALGLRW